MDLVLGTLLLLSLASAARFAWQLRSLRRRYGPAIEVEARVAQSLGRLAEAQALHELAVERAKQQLAQHAAHLESQHGRAMATGQEQLAREAAKLQTSHAERLAELAAQRARAHRELAEVQAQHEVAVMRKQQQLAQETAQLNALRTEYANAKGTYDRLALEIQSLEGNLENIEVGLYSPQFEYDSIERYKRALTELRDEQKSLIKGEQAVTCGVAWMVGNSRREGERMQKQYAKLLLRAFNGECDAAVANVRWDNVTRMEERIRKAFSSINAMGGVMQIALADSYQQLKLRELRLEHEYADRKYQEAEQQRRIREQMREEEKAQRELERAQREATADVEKQEKAIARARKEIVNAEGDAVRELTAKLARLESALAEAQAAKERARSLAEQTRCGYVYIISNHGSFGEGVVKIGMTRRLDPMDRVRELGDASVPFAFDVHGMVYSEDAPALENLLHRRFANGRVNLVNPKKEFFRVGLAEIAEYASAKGLTLELTMAAEAREYRESLAKANAAEPSSLPTATGSARRFPVAV
jgi:Domain of unknown function (DUF4041)/T5orf172 domain